MVITSIIQWFDVQSKWWKSNPLTWIGSKENRTDRRERNERLQSQCSSTLLTLTLLSSSLCLFPGVELNVFTQHPLTATLCCYRNIQWVWWHFASLAPWHRTVSHALHGRHINDSPPPTLVPTGRRQILVLSSPWKGFSREQWKLRQSVCNCTYALAWLRLL